MRLNTSQPLKHAWFHCTMAATQFWKDGLDFKGDAERY
ncbi:hypothetical protein E2C01_009771 [Portunus trituberculatus]|uniref:Uncharacterized protein n=1 Tax=Portunus trituberculatus TaxID=210409 RepID=A0A5B7D6M5_PORTR|nr:hypothetical protein [Portunus trituberculatus]